MYLTFEGQMRVKSRSLKVKSRAWCIEIAPEKDPVRFVMQVVRISSSPILNESMLGSDKSSELKVNRQAIKIKSKHTHTHTHPHPHTHTHRANLKPEGTDLTDNQLPGVHYRV